MEKNSLNPEEWLEYAKADLESAKILLAESENYHIVIFHCQQAVEKIFKRFLIINEKKFPFIHELDVLLNDLCEIKDYSHWLKDVSFIMDLYGKIRYPHGDTITKQEATRSLRIAENIIKRME